jgi:hypothetical protein
MILALLYNPVLIYNDLLFCMSIDSFSLLESSLRYILFLILYCFGSPAIAIIGGQDVEHNSANVTASLVALQMSEVQPDGSIRYYKGSAFLVNQNTLITAGHNVAYIPDPQNIVAIFSSQPCWGVNLCDEKRIPAVDKVVHPGFKQIQGGTEFDLAVVRLSRPAPRNFAPFSPNESAENVGVRSLQVLGFGADRETPNIPISAFRLRFIELFPATSSYRFGSSQKFWLNQGSGGFCSGDSGGPAILPEGNSVAGIAVHVKYIDGAQNCLTQGAFMDLLYFKRWIQDALNQLNGSRH